MPAKTGSLLNYIDSHKHDFLEGLCDLLRMPTVSNNPASAPEMLRCAEHLAEFGRSQLGFNAVVEATEGHPCVIMHSPLVPEAPHVLLYGHYDVQPAEDTELWNTPPFEPVIDGSVIRGRGTCDDKGQVWAWLCAIKSLKESDGSIPLNLTVLLEGEEEIGSLHLADVLKKHADELKGMCAIVSDTGMSVKFCPTIHYALRGLISFEVELTSADCDMHSGVHGGVSPNAPDILARLIAKLHDKDERVTVPGFYDGVRSMASWEADALKRIPFDEQEYAHSFNTVMHGEAGFSTNERRWFRPTLDLNGFSGGYTGPGSKTIIPCKASAKFSARLVADQAPHYVMDCLERWFNKNCPPYIKLNFIRGAYSKPYLLDRNGNGAILYKAASRAIRIGFGKEALICRNGGAIGIVADFTDILAMPTLLLGLGSPDDAIHSPNEKFELDNFFKGIHMGAELLRELANS